MCLNPRQDLLVSEWWLPHVVAYSAVSGQQLGQGRGRPEPAQTIVKCGIDPPPGLVSLAVYRTRAARRPVPGTGVMCVRPSQDLLHCEFRKVEVVSNATLLFWLYWVLSGWWEVEAAAVEVDGGLEVVSVAEAWRGQTDWASAGRLCSFMKVLSVSPFCRARAEVSIASLVTPMSSAHALPA